MALTAGTAANPQHRVVIIQAIAQEQEQHRRQRLGILGGTFNPVHLGHLRLAQEAVEQLGLDLCLLIPAWVPPHKPQANIIAYEHRLRMLQLAAADNARFRVSDLERRLSGKSFTAATLKRLQDELTEPVESHFLLGLDAFLEIQSWWHYREIFELASLAIFRRPDYDRRVIAEQLVRYVSPLYRWNDERGCFVHPSLRPVTALKSTFLDISSSVIRDLLAAGKSVRYLVPDSVLRYIRDEELYTDFS